MPNEGSCRNNSGKDYCEMLAIRNNTKSASEDADTVEDFPVTSSMSMDTASNASGISANDDAEFYESYLISGLIPGRG